MVGRFRTPLKLAPVWNVLITSICKESESEIALLHSQREVKREKVRVGCWRVREGGQKELGNGAGEESQIAPHTQGSGEGQGETRPLHITLHLRNNLPWSPNPRPEPSLLSPVSQVEGILCMPVSSV